MPNKSDEQHNYYIGLMSGTSMDSIDAALVSITEQQTKLLTTHAHPWPDELRAALQKCVQTGQTSLQELGVLDAAVGNLFAAASLALLDKSNLQAADITAIGSHGQTLCHYPNAEPPFTMQIGDPSRIAELTGITTVADFRRRDIAAGGQGAPLVPAFHEAIFHAQDETRIILNIGGIANISILPADKKAISGFDTGPGNCLMDHWINKHQQLPFDAEGQWAQQGKSIPALLELMLRDDFFQQAPAKSTGTEYFSNHWLANHLHEFSTISPADVQHTLLDLSVISIADAITQHAPYARKLFVCGGGVHNSLLMEKLAQRLADKKVLSTQNLGVDPDWVEAQAFAWLARQTLQGKTGNVPEVTGASHPVVLGGIYPGKHL